MQSLSTQEMWTQILIPARRPDTKEGMDPNIGMFQRSDPPDESFAH